MKSNKAVVIGASTGGIKALLKILPELQEAYSFPVIIIIHISAKQPSQLPKVFQEKTKMLVKEAAEKEKINNKTIYFAPAGYHLLVESDETFSLSNDAPVNYSIPSIDVLFTSAADTYKSNLVGILLTGNSPDGANGLEKIKHAGGTTIIQNPDEAEFPIMPQSGLPYVSTENIMTLNQIVHYLNDLHLNHKDSL